MIINLVSETFQRDTSKFVEYKIVNHEKTNILHPHTFPAFGIDIM